jgi:hypothetical protein
MEQLLTLGKGKAHKTDQLDPADGFPSKPDVRLKKSNCSIEQETPNPRV